MSRLNTSKRRKSVRSFGKSNHSARLLLASAVSSALWATQQALGQSIPNATLYWDVNGATSGSGGPTPTGAWGTAVNWNTDPTGGAGGSFAGTTLTSDSLIFAAGTDATSPYTVTVSGTQAAGNIAFMSPGIAALTGGAISLASGGNISNTSGGLATFDTTINTTSGTSFNITGNSSTTFNLINNDGGGGLVTATVSTTGGITTFGGTADNSSGAIVVNSGTVDLSKSSNSGTHAADGLTINGGIVQIDGNPTAGAIDQQVYEGSFIYIGSGTLDLNGRNEGVPSLSGSSSATITNTANSPATLTLGENNNDGNTYNGQIIDGTGGVAVTHIGTGTSILDGVNTFTGGLAIQSGVIQFGTFASLGNGNITLGSIGGSATLNANGSGNNSNSGGFGSNITNPIFSTGDGTNEITATSWSPTFSGPIALINNDLIINANNTQGSSLTVTGGVTGTGNLTLQAMTNSGGTFVQLSGAAINNSGTITNNGTGAQTTTISANIGSNVTNVIENSATSQLTLTGTNTYSGLTINAGTVFFQQTAALGVGNITLGSPGGNATLNANGSGANNGAGGGFRANIVNPIFSTGNGTNTIAVTSWNPTFTGPITLINDLEIISNNNLGSDVLVTGGVSGTGNLTLQSNANTGDPAQITLSTGAINMSGTITNSGTGAGNVNTTISANIGNNVTGVIQNSATSALTLSGNNTYSSPTTISAGTLQLGSANAVQNSTVAMSGGSVAFSTGIGTFTAGGLSGSGNVTLADTGSTAVTLQFNNSGTSTYSGALSGNGGVTMVGTGEQIFSGNNTYSGGTTVNAGTLQLSGSGTLGNTSGTLTVNGGVLDLNATSQSVGVLTGTGGTILDSNASPSTLTVGTGDASGTFAGVIANGNGNVTLVKVGAGTTTLTGNNSFSQLTVASGNVNLNGIGAVGAGAAIVINGGGVTANATRAIGAGAAITINAGQFTIQAVANDPPTNWGNITLSAANGGNATLLINSPVPGGADPIITDQIFSTGNGTNEIMATNWNPTFTGPISLSNDLLIVSNNSGGSNITVADGITGTGNLTLQSNAGTGQPSQIRINTGPVTTSGTITNSGTGSGGNNVTTTISANIGNSTGVIQNSAGSALILSGSNTYPGPTTVNAGTLFLQTSGSNNISHSSAITVASGATLDVTGVSGFTLSNTAGAGGNAGQVLGGGGTVNGALTIGPGSTISAGTSVALGTGGSTAIGQLTSGAQTWNGNGTYSWKISGNAIGTPGAAQGSGDSGTMGISGNLSAGVEGTNWDLLKIGGLSLTSLSSAGPFTIAPVAAITSGNQAYSWVIAQSTGNNSITLPAGSAIGTDLSTTSGSGIFVLDTSGFTDTNNPGLTFASFTLEAENINGNEDLVLDYSAAPEPGTILLVVGGVVPMLMGRRRRRVSPPGVPVFLGNRNSFGVQRFHSTPGVAGATPSPLASFASDQEPAARRV